MADSDSSPVVKAADDFLALTERAWGPQRKREADDLAFQIPDVQYQWDADSRNARKGGTIAGQLVSPRPMLCVSTLDEPIQLVQNQIRAAHLGITIHPLSEQATDETAQVLQGLYRHIEVSSRAHLARNWAADRSTKAGFGVYRVITEYDPDGEPGDQRILIKRVLYQDAVRLDPFAQEPDFSDATQGMVLERMPLKKFKKRYPKSELAQTGESDWAAYLENWPDWCGSDESSDDGAATVLVAEYYELEITETKNSVTDWKGAKSDVPTTTRTLRWALVTAGEELEKQRVVPGHYIPLIGLIGRELQPVEGERFFMGMIRPAKDGARLTNYAASSAVELAALEPKAPWMGEEGIFENHPEWQKSNTVSFATLEYKPLNLAGQRATPPQRVQVDVSRLGPSMQLLTMGRDFVQSATATYDPALGKQTSAHRSGRAIAALQDQTVEGTGNYLDNLAQVAMPYESVVVLDLIPFIYDRPGRVATILDEQDKPSQVILGAPFVPGKVPHALSETDPTTAQRVADPNDPAKHYDLAKGRYGVSVTVGKASAARLQAGADAIGTIIEADPQILPLIGPEWMHFQDFPGKDALEKILRKNRDHQFPWLSDNPDTSAQDLAQAQQQIAMLTEQMQKMQADADKNRAMLAGKQIDAQVKVHTTDVQESADTERAAMDRETKLAVAEIAALAKELADTRALFMEERARIGSQQHEAARAEQDHAHAIEESTVDHDEELTSAAQQAALQPAPTESASV